MLESIFQAVARTTGIDVPKSIAAPSGKVVPASNGAAEKEVQA
jgi:hypothetical protein